MSDMLSVIKILIFLIDKKSKIINLFLCLKIIKKYNLFICVF